MEHIWNISKHKQTVLMLPKPEVYMLFKVQAVNKVQYKTVEQSRVQYTTVRRFYLLSPFTDVDDQLPANGDVH